MKLANSLRTGPDQRGHFGQFGGRYVAETLMPLILDLEREYEAAKVDPAFAAQFDDLLEHYVGRPSPLYHAERLTEHLTKAAQPGKGAKIYFKRDELNHTGAHKINNCVGQILLALRMGKTRIIADRRGPARRGDGDGGGALRLALCHLHGRARY
jgi:tryptophan synthase beta chain